MTVLCRSTTFEGTLAARLALPPPSTGVVIYWLGQAGFVLRSQQHCVVIDPYLSDYLAHKYRGRPLPHRRMMDAPLQPEQLASTTLVLITHHHSDHMDPETLAPLALAAPQATFVAPRASLALAAERCGKAPQTLCAISAGERVSPSPGMTITATRASHETLEQDAAGNYRFLGYMIEMAGLRIFHSGDTVPFDGQQEELRALKIDLALLPVNGRRAALSAQGVPGNLSLQEAHQLCQRCDIRYMIAHHYGLFDFNSADPAEIDRYSSRIAVPTLLRAKLHTEYNVTNEPRGSGTD
ncbi:MBL fold metallo-hydrolase [Paramixta manurensis]|uniref:MBL fold metallo-hydrolase n=1 Tax=Paramixta manurensis TaxID=2740817 RepID=A0A6M8UJ79_9GAMM|nr:MBL fold metallo-hydrolase [Erwiniaceae bacterium PD-1]